MRDDFLMIGCGNMGSAMLKGWVASGALARKSAIHVVKPSTPKSGSAIAGVQYHTSLDDIQTTPAVVILAVKPAMFPEILEQCKARFGLTPVYVSIAAGITLASMQAALGTDAKIIRAMPNTPVEALKGVAGLAATDTVGSETHSEVSKLFAALGLAVWIKEEEMDAFTALCGSGPAYVYYFTECLAEAAKALGLESVDADRLARQMVYGASHLASETSKSLGDLGREVTSPKGTTAAALDVWMQQGTLDVQAKKALKAAYDRAKELAK